MQVVIKLETIGDFMDMVNTLEEKQKQLTAAMKTVNHKSTDADIQMWVQYNRQHANLQTTIDQLKTALK